jgi:P27 family predicted phage terminase small subunit
MKPPFARGGSAFLSYIVRSNYLKMSATRKTIALKALQGTDRPSRRVLPVKQLGLNRPDPVFDLSAAERKLYDDLVEHLDHYGLLHKVDAVGLSLLAKNIAIMKWCADSLKGPGDVVQVFDNGTSNVSGMYTAYTKAQAAFQSLMSKWGLSPVDREKIAGMLLDNEEDEYENFKDA